MNIDLLHHVTRHLLLVGLIYCCSHAAHYGFLKKYVTLDFWRHKKMTRNNSLISFRELFWYCKKSIVGDK